MPDVPNPKSSRSAARLQRVATMVESKLEEPRLALDILVRDAEEAAAHRPDIWDKLHEAAVRDDKVLELSAAYEDLIQRRGMAQVPASTQVQVLFQAATFFAAVLGDQESATSFLARLVAIDPSHTTAFELLERRLQAANDTARLADLYATVGAGKQDRTAQVQLLRKAMTLVEALPTSEAERAVRVLEKLCAVDPANPWYRMALETRYVRLRRFSELGALLEGALAATASADERKAIRLRVIALYLGDLPSPEKAIGHVEEVLREEPQNDAAHKAAEALLKYPVAATRAAAVLADRRRRLAAGPRG
jgi:tetratricopeptide (TPR) repeat protein